MIVKVYLYLLFSRSESIFINIVPDVTIYLQEHPAGNWYRNYFKKKARPQEEAVIRVTM